MEVLILQISLNIGILEKHTPCIDIIDIHILRTSLLCTCNQSHELMASTLGIFLVVLAVKNVGVTSNIVQKFTLHDHLILLTKLCH